MAKDKFVPIDPSIVDQPDDTSSPTTPSPDPVAPPADPATLNTQATAPENRTAEQQKALADSGALYAAQLQAEAAAVAKRNGSGDRAPILTPEEEALAASGDKRAAALQGAQDTAQAESDVPTALKLPLMAVKGVLSAVDQAGKAVGIDTGWRPDEIPSVGGTSGAITKGVAQFTSGMVAGGSALKAVGLVSNTSVIINGVRNAAAMGIAGAFGQDPHEENLSNLIQSHPTLSNPINAYLAAKPDDSEAEARFKKFIENAGLGAVSDGLMVSLKGIRALRAAKAGEPGAAAIADKALNEELPQVMQSSGKIGNTRPLPGKEAEFAATNRGLISPEDADKLRASVDLQGPQQQGTHFNFEHLPDNYDAKAMINDVSKVVGDSINEVTGGVQTRQATEDLAGMLGQKPSALIGAIAKDAVGAKEAAARVVAGKSLLVDLSQQITDQSRTINAMVANGVDTAAEEAKLLKLMNVHADLQVNLKGAITGAARTTAAGNIDIKEAAQLFAMADGNPVAISKLVRAPTFVDKAIGAIQTYRINCMLSSVKTLAVKGTADALNAVGLPAAKIIGGALHRDMGAIRDGLGTYVGLTKSLGDAFSMARKALNDGHQNLIPHTSVEGAVANVLPTTAKPGVMANLMHAIGSTVQFPTRLIGTLDEFSKQLSYRAAVYSQAAREGATKGLTGDSLAQWIEDSTSKAFDAQGAGTNETALRYAKEATFTQDLDYGIGKWISDGANKHPVVKTIVPFTKIPLNLFRQAWAATPGLQWLQRGFAEDMAAGGTRAAAARGKQVIGAMAYAHAVNLATSGRLTGAGPADPEARKNLLATGWQPYSFKIGDKYYSYARLDPFAMPFGLAADFSEAAGQMSSTDAESTAAAMGVSLAHNLTNKTYFGGMVSFLDALAAPENKMLKLMEAFAGSFVPNTRQFTDMLPETADPYMREARSVMDAVRKKVPGLSSTLAPNRNIYGEPIRMPAGFGPDTLSPFYTSEENHDALLKELTKFPKGFNLPGKKIGNIDLTQIPSKEGGFDAYDRLLQLNGSVKVGGSNLKDHLSAFIASDTYQKLTDDGPGYTGSKFEALGQLLGQHRSAALEALRAENPQVKAALLADRTNKAAALNKGPQAVNPLQGLLNMTQPQQ